MPREAQLVAQTEDFHDPTRVATDARAGLLRESSTITPQDEGPAILDHAREEHSQ